MVFKVRKIHGTMLNGTVKKKTATVCIYMYMILLPSNNMSNLPHTLAGNRRV